MSPSCVAHKLKDAPAVLLDLRLKLLAVRLVPLDQARIAYIGDGENSG
jgi:hypothetical protein